MNKGLIRFLLFVGFCAFLIYAAIALLIAGGIYYIINLF